MTTARQLLSIISKEGESTSTLTVLAHPHNNKKSSAIFRGKSWIQGTPEKSLALSSLYLPFSYCCTLEETPLWSLLQIEQSGGSSLSLLLVGEML